MKKSSIILATGLAIASSSGAQLLGIGAGLDAGARLDIGAPVRGTVRAVADTATHVGAGISAGAQGDVHVQPSGVRGDADISVENDVAAPRQRRGAGYEERRSATRVESSMRSEAGTRTEMPRDRPMRPHDQGRVQPIAAGQASGSVGVGASMPRVDIATPKQVQVRGGLLVR